jgi:hypothetical protein
MFSLFLLKAFEFSGKNNSTELRGILFENFIENCFSLEM